eukprot:evm.model.NODE_36126_length_19233_cov_20.094889.3
MPGNPIEFRADEQARSAFATKQGVARCGVRMLSSSTVLRMVDMEDARVIVLKADHVMAAYAAVDTFVVLCYGVVLEADEMVRRREPCM